MQVQQGMQFRRALNGAELGPRADREAGVDGRGVQGADGVVKVPAEVFVGGRALPIGIRAKSAQMRQSRALWSLARVLRAIAPRMPLRQSMVRRARRQTSISLKLWREVSWANAMPRNWSRHLHDWTWRLPLQRSAHAGKRRSGGNSISCTKTRRPECMIPLTSANPWIRTSCHRASRVAIGAGRFPPYRYETKKLVSPRPDIVETPVPGISSAAVQLSWAHTPANKPNPRGRGFERSRISALGSGGSSTTIAAQAATRSRPRFRDTGPTGRRNAKEGAIAEAPARRYGRCLIDIDPGPGFA